MRKLVWTSVLAVSLALPAVACAPWFAGLAVGAGGAKVAAGSYAAGVRGSALRVSFASKSIHAVLALRAYRT